ncbi:hypothetical protein X897_3314 [Burkholderia pseudomallei ABCPW 30]|uniref:hypothetical protein n=1 Tax=Burkholderia pseudomallei TaxID=28450 RepID=UPI000538C3F3|nr:hypothetical protein [Burkholderia pseudomallei]KGV91162.1 hypothetical protein X897_3314 [Burkholderia pseudomallei ABCPW 30]
MNRLILRCTTALIGSGAFVYACAQTYDGTTAPIDTSDCRAITGQADIDGTMQQVVGRACLQSDGTWRLVQNPDGSVPWYPLAAYPYPDPWYWGAPFFVGAGTTFVFVDRFHHFHRFHRFHPMTPSHVGPPAGGGVHHGPSRSGGMGGWGGTARH